MKYQESEYIILSKNYTYLVVYHHFQPNIKRNNMQILRADIQVVIFCYIVGFWNTIGIWN